MNQQQANFALNRGLVSPLGLARTDQKRVALGARTMTNWMPRVLGSMSFRPGLGYIGATYQNAAARYLPFVFATTDTALVELTNLIMRVWINDVVLTRVAVSSAITNGTFAGDISGWTVSSGNVIWVAGNEMQFVSNGTADEYAYQTVTCLNTNVEHALRIVVERGPLRLRIGSTVGGTEYRGEITLDSGTHSIAFTPTGDFTVEFLSSRIPKVLLVSCTIEAAGVVTLPTPWAAANLGLVRFDQSGDILFCACQAIQQRKIERFSARSWSIVTYAPDDGPFMVENVTPLTMTAGGLTGDTTLTASGAYFKSTHVGALFTLTSTGQTVTKSMTVVNDATNSVRVTGVSTDRAITIVITGLSGTGNTVILQRSFDNATWVAVPSETWVADITDSYNDLLDNQIVYYRLLCSVYAGGTTTSKLFVNTGSIVGVCRATSFSSVTVLNVAVLSDFGSIVATDVWSEGNWSDYRGWPTAVRFHEGRLWWFGKNGIWGSVSDAFASFNPNFLGDAGPLNRTIGSGPVDVINWGLSVTRLIMGAQGSELEVRSSSLDEPLTPTNFNIKPASTQGSAPVEPVKIDQRGLYVQRGGARVFELAFNIQNYGYASTDMTALVPELCSAGITRIAAQRQPDTRIHCIQTGVNPAVMVRDAVEDVMCWLEVDTDGVVEDVVVLPGANGSIEDQVYYVVNRTINGATVRYLEKWAKETECRGTFSTNSMLNKQADAFIVYSGGATNVITGLSHLEGESVVVWGDGEDLSPSDANDVQTTYTVSGGQITLAAGVSVANAVVGLPYTGQWRSTKLGMQSSEAQSLLNQQKRTSHMGLVMAYVHAKGLKYGPDFTSANMNDLPEIEQGAPVGANAVRETYDEQEIEFPGTWVTDLSLCLKAQAPRPVTVMAAVSDLEIHH